MECPGLLITIYRVLSNSLIRRRNTGVSDIARLRPLKVHMLGYMDKISLGGFFFFGS